MEDNFQECETCNAKPGMPRLCEGCLNNRAAMSKQAAEIERLTQERDEIKRRFYPERRCRKYAYPDEQCDCRHCEFDEQAAEIDRLKQDRDKARSLAVNAIGLTPPTIRRELMRRATWLKAKEQDDG